MTPGMLKNDEGYINIYRNVSDKDHQVGAIIWAGIELDEETRKKYISVGRYRRAFIGDMQKELDEIHKRDHVKDFACAVKYGTRDLVYVDRVVYVRENIFTRFWERIKSTFKRRKSPEKDDFLDYFLSKVEDSKTIGEMCKYL